MWDPRLLVVDDDKVVADLVGRIASGIGFKTQTTSGTAVASQYEDFAPDVVALDILMPEIDGFEVMRYISESPRPISIIILSGTKTLVRTMAERMGKDLGLSIIANVPKPFTIQTLHEVFLKAKRRHPVHVPVPLKKPISRSVLLQPAAPEHH